MTGDYYQRSMRALQLAGMSERTQQCYTRSLCILVEFYGKLLIRSAKRNSKITSSTAFLRRSFCCSSNRHGTFEPVSANSPFSNTPGLKRTQLMLILVSGLCLLRWLQDCHTLERCADPDFAIGGSEDGYHRVARKAVSFRVVVPFPVFQMRDAAERAEP